MSSNDIRPNQSIDTKAEPSGRDSTNEPSSTATASEQPARYKDPMEEFLVPAMVGSVVVVWIAFCTVVVYGFAGGIVVYLGGALTAGVLLGIVVSVFIVVRTMKLWWLPAWLYVVPPVVWLFVVGHYNGWRDYLILFAMLLLVTGVGSKALDAIVARESSLDRTKVRNRFQVVEAGVYLLLVWAVTSLGDHLLGPFWSLQSPLLRASSQSQAVSGEPEKGWVAVALSGGGFRAALLHAGVLDALEGSRFGVTALSSVSGGSIIGGFYALGGAPQLFKEAVIERRFNLRRDLIDAQNFLRLPKPGRVTLSAWGRSWEVPILPVESSFTRTDVLAEQLARVLFDDTSLRNAKYRNELLWVIGTTDLLSGDAVGLSAKGVYRRSLPHAEVMEGYLRRRHTESIFSQVTEIQPDQVGQVVAASSAFPGAFVPIAAEYTEADGAKRRVNLLLADGGVTDNSGIALLQAAWNYPPPRGPSRPFNLVIASNGGETLRPKGAEEDISGLLRSLDVIYAASGVYVPEDEARKNGGPKIVQLTPELTLPESSRAVRELINWASRRDLGALPVRPHELRALLERELPDTMLDGLKKVGPIQRPDSLAESWRLVIKRSGERAFDGDRVTARLDVVLDFVNALSTFERTSTLNDTLSSTDVEALYRLGQYLVYLRLGSHGDS